MCLLQLLDATLRRPSGFTLTSLNWSLRQGEHWAVLGPVGSGKSLFVDALAGRVPISKGQFLHPVGPLQTQVELVARDYTFDWRVAGGAQYYQQRFNAQAMETVPTVRDALQGLIRPVGTINLASVPLPPPTCSDAELTAIAAQMRLEHLLDQPLTALSNGETRRTLLARSLLRRPRILLLDNPFSGLDADSRQLLHATLEQVAQSGVSLVMVVDERDLPRFITHRLVLNTADVPAPASHNPPTLTPEPDYPAGATPLFTNAVRMRGVTVRYGAKTVLNRIDWTVRRGEKWALLGPNGSGKSTLLSLITADNPQAYANAIELFDRRRGTGESIWSIKQRIGFVSPELHLYFPRQTRVREVIASGLFDTMGLFRKLTPSQADLVDAQLRSLDLWSLRDQPLSALSAGHQRWALLGRALIKSPPLLVLDEPTQGLDEARIDQFRQLIDERCIRHPDQTLIYVTHYPDELPRCVDQTLQLAGGRVVP